ncbi:MAG: hypothetical protein EOL89_06050 [Actinobacteria bacterium]|nr:hypothetical protein [Actinomycetota bacterium]
MTNTPKPTARLVATAWLLIGGGLLALIVAFVVNFYDVPIVTSVLAPIGWIALVAGFAVAGVAAYRRAAARDARS